MNLYDPDRDPVRRAGRWLRWGTRWVALPVVLGVFVSGNLDARSLPVFGPERESAVLFLDGQAYFGHLDDSGDGGTLVLRDVYYFANATGSLTGLPVGLVKRGTEAHEPADGMRINRDRVLAIEQVGPAAPVMQAIEAERQIVHSSPAVISLNRTTIGAVSTLTAQRVAAEHDVQRGYTAAVDQLAKLNALVLPVSKAEAAAITDRAVGDLRTVRRNALAALGTTLGFSATDAQTYAGATEAVLANQTFANEPGVLLAPDLNGIVNRATELYGQVGDTYAKQLTQPKTASPSPTPSPSARP
ncbi:MAG: hypothetical protein E6H84_13315 [Chloroflexi bacterium]|nr:MAG: hypothetical protein E6H84_13315 [Chloroflexota bacterium]